MTDRSTRRPSMAVALGLVLLALVAAVAWSRLGLAEESATGQAVKLTRAQVVQAGMQAPDRPPQGPVAAPAIDLPDNWDSRRPGYAGTLRFDNIDVSPVGR